MCQNVDGRVELGLVFLKHFSSVGLKSLGGDDYF